MRGIYRFDTLPPSQPFTLTYDCWRRSRRLGCGGLGGNDGRLGCGGLGGNDGRLGGDCGRLDGSRLGQRLGGGRLGLGGSARPDGKQIETQVRLGLDDGSARPDGKQIETQVRLGLGGIARPDGKQIETQVRLGLDDGSARPDRKQIETQVRLGLDDGSARPDGKQIEAQVRLGLDDGSARPDGKKLRQGFTQQDQDISMRLCVATEAWKTGWWRLWWFPRSACMHGCTHRLA